MKPAGGKSKNLKDQKGIESFFFIEKIESLLKQIRADADSRFGQDVGG